MVSLDLPIKYSVKGLILCEICLRIKNRSKRFSSVHALQWHVSHNHKNDTIVYGVNLE